jgi:hypothetical protein
MFGGVGPGRKGGMSNDCLVIGVAVVGVCINSTAIQQKAKPPFAEAIIIAHRQITTQLIDSYL